MRLRPVISAAVVLCVISTTPSAFAATKKKAPVKKPVCKLILDDEGDGRTYGGAIKSDMLDITSGDIASNGSRIAATLRLKSSSPSGDTWVAIAGYSWAMDFKLAGQKYTFQLVRGTGANGGVTGHFVLPSGDRADSTLKFSMANNAITWSISRKAVAALSKSKTFTDLGAGSWATVGTKLNADAAGKPGVKYTDQWPSCLPVPLR